MEGRCIGEEKEKGKQEKGKKIEKHVQLKFK